MRLALMQPYFFPYLGHFALIAQVECWVVFDTAQHIRRGWMNRNRVLKPGGGWQYVNIPIKRCPRDTSIQNVVIDQETEWQQKLLRKLDCYKGKAPYFNYTMNLLEECLKINENRLAPLNVHLLAKVCDALEIRFNPVFLSETQADPGPCSTSGERVLQIASYLKASTYLNPVGGAHLLDEEAFKKRDIGLEIQKYVDLVYDTRQLPFEPGLSIIDALMWNSRDVLREHVLLKRDKISAA